MKQKIILGDVLTEVKAGIGKDWAKYPVMGATRDGLAPAKERPGKSPQRYKPVLPGTIFYNPMRILIGSIAFVDDDDLPGITSLRMFRDELLSDSLAAKRVEVGIITFGPVNKVQDFQTASQFNATDLSASGDTPMGAAIVEGLEFLKSRKAVYRTNGIAFFRPWIFLITDGAPTDAWKKAAEMIREGEEKKSFSFFAAGVESANMEILKQICVREPLKLKGLQFRSLFQWLSNSMKSVSHSGLGTEVPLQNPATPDGWATA